MANYKSMSVAAHHLSAKMSIYYKVSMALALVGLFVLFSAWFSNMAYDSVPLLTFSLLSMALGILGITYSLYADRHAGIKNNGVWHDGLTSRGTIAWASGIILTAFYVILYWYPQVLGLGADGSANMGLIRLFDPLSRALNGKQASQWFVYGALYTFVILFLGIKFMVKYIHNKYQIYRTISIIFFQTFIAFLLPEVLQSLNLPYNDFKNIWPLNYYFFFDWHLDELQANGTFGIFILVWGILSFLVFTPILTYFFGKRWYCSWVCGCGGLAETAGDPFRHLSDKSVKSWKIERYLIYSVLVFAVVMTIGVLYTRFTGNEKFLFVGSDALSSWYGFYIGAIFSGIIGVGFYPLMGSRVWCRFGCPMAAYLGIFQRKASKFRITTNGGQCISCGNCSTYCEMGINVKSYAQKGQDIVRASCVGCGICSAVCPRGVLRLEDGSGDISSRAEEKRNVLFSELQNQ